MNTTSPTQTDKLHECEKALDVINLSRLLSEYGHFDDVNGDLVGYCPFHYHEKGSRASLVVKPQSKEFHCVSPRCYKRGSIIQLIVRFEKSDIDSACAKILNLRAIDEPVVQDILPFIEQPFHQEKLPEYSQTPLRILRQCPLRHWNEYTKGVKLDKQTIESTIGSLIHSALQDFYNLPETSRKQSDLTFLFAKGWGKGYGPQDEREYWLQKAQTALQNAFDLNLHLKPAKMQMEVTKSTYFPFDSPRYKLKSKPDRVDWYSDSEYCLIDYKWDEKPLSEEDAIIDFQTVFYYLTWMGDMEGVPPKLISYQFLTPGIQVDVTPTMTTMEAGIERLIHYIEKAENLKSQTTEPEATRNDYCYNCKLYGKCPATKLSAI